MKITNLNRKSDKELIQMKKDLEMGLLKTTPKWSEGKVSKKERGGEMPKGYTKSGIKTKLKHDLQRNIAQLNTVLIQRGLSEEACKGKPKSKRRVRRLRGRLK